MSTEHKAVLLSILPEWVYEIANGYKQIEVRKSCRMGFDKRLRRKKHE